LVLKLRIIPTLLLKRFGLVKGVRFDSWRQIGPLLPAVKVYNYREVDELIILDIEMHRSEDCLDFELVSEFSPSCFVPLTVGGGVKSIKHVQHLLRAGADKIAINSEAYARPDLITDIANLLGSQCVVASIDVRKQGGRWMCFSHAGQQPTGHDVRAWARELEDRGAGEILLTSIDCDGTMQGYDIPLLEAVTSVVNIPVIASGGAGSYQHMIDAVKQAGVSAVAAASMFHFTEQTPAGAKAALQSSGICVRTPYTE
jgi:imidazole glycerol-phosphate synthase subunit HisF